jgi:hypothetical protein
MPYFESMGSSYGYRRRPMARSARYGEDSEFLRGSFNRRRRKQKVLELFDRIVNAIPRERQRYLARDISQLELILDQAYR